MKKLLIAALIATSMTATADDKLHCAGISIMAKSIMEVRQDGGDMIGLLKVCESMDASMASVCKIMTMLAYDQPMYSATNNKAREVVRFKNKMALECVKVNVQ